MENDYVISCICDTFLQDLLYPLFVQSVDDVGDLYIDVADAYTENGKNDA